MRAVLLAGGKGTRLRPYTTLIPKPLMPIGGEKAIIEIIITQLVAAGFDHVTIAVNHLANLIMSFVGDGSRWNIKVDYSREDKPLSTMGPLKLIEDLPENFLVMNGDILTNLDFGQLYRTHMETQPPITVATYNRTMKVDYGVLEVGTEKEISAFKEKPELPFLVSMGVYIVNKKILNNFQKGDFYGFDHLMHDCLKQKNPAKSFPWDGFWLDIGRPEDYDYCNENYTEIAKKLNL